jgi:putative hydrolase of HD superfamily
MSHLVMVTFISYILWNYENQNGKNYSIYNMMMKSLYHDIPEAITWDIITPTKKSIEWFRETLEKVEKQMLNDSFFVYITDDYKNQIQDYMLNPFDDDEWILTKKSDIISAFFEAKIEADSWNPEFDNIYKRLKKTVAEFNLVSSDHFLKEILMDFEEDYSNIDFNK